jgi:hypothetical protein
MFKACEGVCKLPASERFDFHWLRAVPKPGLPAIKAACSGF